MALSNVYYFPLRMSAPASASASVSPAVVRSATTLAIAGAAVYVAVQVLHALGHNAVNGRQRRGHSMPPPTLRVQPGDRVFVLATLARAPDSD